MTTNTNDAPSLWEELRTAGDRYWGKPKERAAFECGVTWGFHKWHESAALTTAAGAVKESLTAAHALPPGIARDDTVHGEMYYTAEQVRAVLAQAAPAAVAGPSDEEIESVWGRYDEGLETRVALARRILALAAPAPPAQAADSVLEDAARYRWLRAGVRERQGVPVSGHRTMSSNHLRALMEFNFWCTPDELDAAIDAARAQAKEGA